MTDSLRERIARAIAESFSQPDGIWEIWLPQVDAALAAIEASGPTPEMVEAGWTYLGMVDLAREELAGAFRVMIAAARPRDLAPTEDK